MLTKSHQAARRYVRPQDRPAYRQHMCGLCHALGDGYGLASRLLTNHEMILLNLLTSAQQASDPPVIKRRCPLNPSLTVATNAGRASQFAAAASVSLAAISVADDVQDSHGRSLSARFIQRWMQGAQQKAHTLLKHLALENEALVRLGARQVEVESDPQQDPAAPSAEASAALFAMTAQLANSPQNAGPLRIVGAQYGAYLYLADAYRDYAHDLTRGDYNPLRSYVTQQGDLLILSRAGLVWLRERLRLILAEIRGQLPLLVLRRYQETIAHLLTDPIAGLIGQIESALERSRSLAVRRWRLAEVLKAALFVLPEPVADTGLAGVYRSQGLAPEDEEDLSLEPRGKRKRKRHPTETAATTTDSHAGFFLCDVGSWECAYCSAEVCASGICDSMGRDGCDSSGCGCDNMDCDCST